MNAVRKSYVIYRMVPSPASKLMLE